MERLVSTVKWFDNNKGFGFIHNPDPQDQEKDIFVHYRSILGEGFKTMSEGEHVEFYKVKTDGGRYAATEVISTTNPPNLMVEPGTLVHHSKPATPRVVHRKKRVTSPV